MSKIRDLKEDLNYLSEHTQGTTVNKFNTKKIITIAEYWAKKYAELKNQIEETSQWLQNNDFEEASKILDCEFEL